VREVAFIDGIIRGTESDNRRFESPQLPTGPSFSDLLSQVERSRFNTTAYSRIDTAPRNPPESGGSEQPLAATPEREGPAEGAEERHSSMEENRGNRSRESRENADSERAVRENRENADAAREQAVRDETAREEGERSAEARVARERNEANQLRAEEAGKKVARAGGETEEGESLAASGKGDSLPAEGPEAEELSKLAVGEGLPALSKQAESSKKEAESGRPGGKRSGETKLVELAGERSRSLEKGTTESEKLREASIENQDRSTHSSAKGDPEAREGAVATELSGGKALFREFARVSSGQETPREEIRQKAEKALSDLESRERSEGSERKLRVVDLRAPREGRGRGDGASERNSDGTGRNGLKETAQAHSFEGGESNTLRFDGGESAFARHLGAPNRGDGVAQRLVQQQQQLHRFLQEKGYGEIVRNARIMLREGGNGELRLNLSPKELGSVRVQLQLQDSHIAGRIIVENSTVREVFEQNLDQLQRAFQSQGLETGRLEVAVEQRGDGRERRGRGETGRGDGARIFEEHTARLPDSFYEDAQVNLMA
jgi:flagellar hook-length control protein FliK